MTAEKGLVLPDGTKVKPMDPQYNKAYAVGQYAHALGLAVGEMMQRGDHKDYTWNSGNANNPHRIEMLEAIHQRAMKAIDSLNE